MIKKLLGNGIVDSIIIFLSCLSGVAYLEIVYEPAALPFAIIYYVFWFRYMWAASNKRATNRDSLKKLMDMCEKPKDRWGKES